MTRLTTTRVEVRDLRTAATPTVTVVIPCFNYARYLPAAVRSVLAQQEVIVDVIVVDDASDDGSAEVADALAAEDPRVSVLRNDHNRGPVATFNRGLAAARSEFLVRLDADDLLTPGSLARSTAALTYLPTVGLVYGHPLHFSGQTLPAPRTQATAWYVWAGPEWLALRCADGNNVITSPEVAMRRSVVDRVGGQRDLAHSHDMEMWLRIAAHSDVAYIAGADQAWHREHPASLSTRALAPLTILQEVHAAFETLLDDLGPTYPRSGELRSLARSAVAREAITQARRLIDRGWTGTESARLVAYAADCSPKFDRTRSRTLPPSVMRLLGIAPRLRRRFRDRTRGRRWRRNGVYERLRFVGSRRGIPDDGPRR